jgi:hypothetical protein
LSWSREVARRYAGSTATLLIDDDGQRRIVPIGHELLSTGRVLYAPKSPDVLFRLTIAIEPGREVGESVQTIASAGAAPAQPAAVLQPLGTRTRTSEPPPKKVYLPVTAPFRNTASSRMPLPPARPFDTSTVRQARVPIPRIADVAAPDAAQLHVQRQADIASVAAPVQSIGSIARPAAPAVTVPAPQPTAPYNAPATTPVTTLPQVLRQVPLSTPPDVRRLIREDITIRVNATLDSAGQVTAAQALATGSYVVTTLARAAEENARRWLFAPATVNGQAVPSKFIIEYKVKANR